MAKKPPKKPGKPGRPLNSKTAPAITDKPEFRDCENSDLFENPRFRSLSTKEKCLALKSANPSISNTDIGKQLGISEAAVRVHLSSPKCDDFRNQLDREIKDFLVVLRERALYRLEELLESPKTPASVRLSAIKLLLEDTIKDTESDADEWIFETFITETGVLEKQIKKIYRKANEQEEKN